MTPLAMCILIAVQTYAVSPAALVGILETEGGRVGQEVRNTNGTYDLGPMQINTLWMPVLAEKWGVDEDKARTMVRDDMCVNIGVAAWILRSHYDETGDFKTAIKYYHSRTPHLGERYKKKVFAAMERHGLLHRGL